MYLVTVVEAQLERFKNTFLVFPYDWSKNSDFGKVFFFFC